MYVATIVANAKKCNLSGVVLQSVRAELADVSRVEVIVEARVADIYFEQIDLAYKPPAGFDFIVQKAAARRKKLLVCDMESTIIENEFLDEIAELGGFKEQVAMITEKAMNGEIGFREAIGERVKILKGMPESEIRALLETRLAYNQGARELIAVCKKAGIYTMLVSGGFTIFSDYVARELGFDAVHANTLEFEHGFLKSVSQPLLGKEAKLEIMNAQATKMGITVDDCAAIGDGANDLPMLRAAGLGIAYKAKAKVRAEIKNQINSSDLMAVAYAIGIK